MTCNYLIDCGEMIRCGCPEDDEMHDPLHPHGHHPYSPDPAGAPCGGECAVLGCWTEDFTGEPCESAREAT